MLKKIAILGATGHIAKGLILGFMQQAKPAKLFLFARSPEKVSRFIAAQNLKAYPRIDDFKHFAQEKYDVVINCVGVGTPLELKQAGSEIFKLTEEFDNLVLGYLRRHPDARYINFSSGAIYSVAVCAVKPEHYYGIAKLHQEAKHRSLSEFRIVDLRVFSYFSRFIEMDSGYFLTELLKCLKAKKTFVTNACDFVRDFLAPQDLFDLVCLIIKQKPFNGAFDVYSAKPVSKFKLLEYFVKNYSLKYVTRGSLKLSCPTGAKVRYCSHSKKAASLGYKPKFSSLETVAMESKYVLGEVNG